jgi:hypothetical protein
MKHRSQSTARRSKTPMSKEMSLPLSAAVARKKSLNITSHAGK